MFVQNYSSIEDLIRANLFMAQKGSDIVFRSECADDTLISYASCLDAYLFMSVLDGSVQVVINGRQWQLEKGSLLMLKPYVSVSEFSPSDNYQARLLLIDKHYLEQMDESNRFHGLLNSYIAANHIAVLDLDACQQSNIRYSWEWFAKVTPAMDVYKEHWVKYYLNAVLIELSEILHSRINDKNVKIVHKAKLFQQFLQLLTANFSNQHHISFYAANLGISSVYLSRIVKELSGKTVHDYIAERLYITARHLLSSTDLTISEIAYKLNFSDQSAFGKFFKSFANVSPLNFRKQIR